MQQEEQKPGQQAQNQIFDQHGEALSNSGHYAGYQPRQSTDNEAFVAMLSQRVARRVADEIEHKATGKAPSANQRLALAIISLITLFLITTAIFLADRQGNVWPKLLVILIAAIATCIINIVFNIAHR